MELREFTTRLLRFILPVFNSNYSSASCNSRHFLRARNSLSSGIYQVIISLGNYDTIIQMLNPEELLLSLVLCLFCRCRKPVVCY